MAKTNVLTRLRNWVSRDSVEIVDSTLVVPEEPSKVVVVHRQAHPMQSAENERMMFAPFIDLRPIIAQYGLNSVVYATVNRITLEAANSEFMVSGRFDAMIQNLNHPLLELVGKFGAPNPDQDSFEFWEKHFQCLCLTGNSYWFWDKPNSRFEPTELYLLEPENMRIVPGLERTIGHYEYWNNGVMKPLSVEQITHFRKPSPFSRYYGLSPLIAPFPVIYGDNLMLQWNNDIFNSRLGMPAGILIVPQETSDEDIERIRLEFIAQHGEQRTVAVVRSEAGSAVWLEGGLKARDADFEGGRGTNRKNIIEASGTPLGVTAETTTEASALVFERAFARMVYGEMTRSVRKLNRDGLPFWPDWRQWQCLFADNRKNAVDWRREYQRFQAMFPVLSRDEIRQREFQLGHTDDPPAGPITKAVKNGNEARIDGSNGDGGGD